MKTKTNKSVDADDVDLPICKQNALEANGADMLIAGIPCYSRRALAQTLGLSKQTLAQWVVKKQGPRMIRIGKSSIYPLAEVRKWLERNMSNKGETDDDATLRKRRDG